MLKGIMRNITQETFQSGDMEMVKCNFKSKKTGCCMLKQKIALNNCKCDGENCILQRIFILG